MTTVQPFNVDKKESRMWGIVTAILYFLLYMGVSFGVSLGATLFVASMYPDEASQTQAFNECSNLLMVVIDVIIVLALSVIVLASGKSYFHGMGLRTTRKETIPVAFLTGLGLSCMLSFVMALVTQLFPKIMEEYNQAMEASYNMGQVVLYILAGVIGAPLVEELIFRQFMAGNLSQGVPRWLAILLTSIVFGAVHLQIVQVIYAAVLGVVMACLYFAYDSILPTIALHAGFNAVSLLTLIDTTKWSEATQQKFDMGMTIAMFAFVLIAMVGLVCLYLRKTHSIWKNDPPAVEEFVYEVESEPRATAVEWNQLLETPRQAGVFPTVAELSANMKGKAEDTPSAESSDADQEPIESQSADETEEVGE